MQKQEIKKAQKIMRGVVVSDRMDKTIVVEHRRSYRDSYTSKIREMKKKYKVHDEQELAKMGDVVEFHEGRPYSKTKYMYLTRVVPS